MTSVDGYQASQPRIKATLESCSHLLLLDTGSSVSNLPVGLVQNEFKPVICPSPCRQPQEHRYACMEKSHEKFI